MSEQVNIGRIRSSWDSSKSDYENIINKAADIRELIWDHYPDSQDQMMTSPYMVLLLAEEALMGLIGNKKDTP